MINLSPTQIGGIATLFVAMEITNQAEVAMVIKQLQAIQKLDGVTVNINLRTKSGSVSTKSLIKPPTIAPQDVSEVLAIADRVVSPWYVAPEVGQPVPLRTKVATQPIRAIVQKELKKREKGGVITSRKEYMNQTSQSLRNVMRGKNDIYSAWVRMVTA